MQRLGHGPSGGGGGGDVGRVLGQRQDIAQFQQDRVRHLPGHAVEMALDKADRDDKLQPHDRQDENQQRPPVEAARHSGSEPAERHGATVAPVARERKDGHG